RPGGGLHREQRADAELEVRDDGKSDRRARGGSRVIDQLHEGGVLRNMWTVSPDVVREDRSAEHQDQVAPLEAGDDLLAVRGQKACEQGVLLGQAVRGREGT